MLSSLKTTMSNTRRRLAERALQAVGAHDATDDDKAFETARRRYEELIDQLKEVLNTMEEYLAALGTMLETQLRLAGAINVTFADQPFIHVSNKYAMVNRTLLKEYALIKQIYRNHVFGPAKELLDRVPVVNELLEQRSSIKLDYDSYDRRFKGEVSKDPTSAATQKLTRKLHNTRVKLTEITDDIKDHFEAFEYQRPSMLVSELSALVGIQHSLSSRNAALLSSLLPSVPHASVSMCAMAHGQEGNVV